MLSKLRMFGSVAFKEPAAVMSRWRHRKAYARMNRAFFYQRYATAILLGSQLGVYAALGEKPQTAEELAKQCGIRPGAASALLRILESEGLLKREGKSYHLSAFAAEALQGEGPFAVTHMLDLLVAQTAAFPQVADGMRTGKVPDSLDIFSDQGNHQAFLTAVNGYLRWATLDFLNTANLPKIRTFIVGSMGVSFSSVPLKRFPDAKVTYGCLEHLAREIPRLREEYDVPPGSVIGTHSHGGDPSEDKWGDEAFDLVFLTKKMILDPEQSVGERFAKKALTVLNPGGVAVFWETVHTTDKPSPLPTAMEAVYDLVASPISPARTASDYRDMLLGMGYASVEVMPLLEGHTNFIIARKPGL